VIGKISSILGIVLSLALISSISLETFTSPTRFEQRLYYDIQLWVCLYFLTEFFVLFSLSPQKGRFLLRNFLFIFLYIPYLNLFEYYSLSFSDETAYVLRLVPLVRGGVALVLLTRITIKNNITSLFVSYIVIFVALCYFQTLTFYIFESGVNPEVKTYGDAAWWAALTVTTVGSNIIAVTTMGKVCTALLAVIGMTTFPIFTVYITTLVHRLNANEKAGML